MNRFALVVPFLSLTACLHEVPPPDRAIEHGDGGEGEGAVAGEGEGTVAGEGEGAVGGEGEGDSEGVDVDDAAIVDASFPAALDCNGAGTATITVQNMGNTTWTAAAGYKLGAVDDADPFADGRVLLDDTGSVPPGATYTFTIDMTAPATIDLATYTTDWRMVRENVRWFGASLARDVAVDCTPPPPPPALDLGAAIIENSPNVATWSETARITTLDLGPNGVFVDFTKRDGPDSWPDVPFGAPGDSLEYTLWIVINIDGQWYASGCIEYWRGLDRNGGPPTEYAQNWYYDSIRWGPMVGHQPAPGETVGFLVTAGDARNNGNALVEERSNVVMVEFPADANGAVYHF